MANERFKHRNNVLSKEQSLAILKKERRAFYDKIVSIDCPVLGETVYFTAQGFDHLINESNSKQGDSKPRKSTEQYMKLMHLDYVPLVIKNCERVSEKRTIRKKVKGRWKKGFQHELVCDVEGIGKIGVIVENIGAGRYKFLSVMPQYKKARKTKKRPKGRS